ncbi:MAG TPA: DUF2203 domain-containing protein [Alloacidobacterium sp.]|jgi:hypothetical protein|nr:DUF2203 domain-containing protein [Alloacidobacterium sp.]
MKTFTLDEAQSLLPVLESLLKRAIEGKKSAEENETKLQELRQRIFLSGGMQVNVISALRQRAEIDRLVQQAKDAVAEIDSIGVQVKDLDTGLLDFPCLIDGEIVLLCWKMGESRIDFWHTVDAGFRGRQPLDERFGRSKPERPN